MAKTDDLRTIKKATKKSGKKPVKGQNKITKYFRDLKSEFKKVVWPSRKKVLNNTWAVLVGIAVSGIGVYAMDIGLSWLLNAALNLASGTGAQ